MRKSIPPVVTVFGSFNLHSPGYANNTSNFGNGGTFHHDIKMVIVQNNKVHSAIVDEKWDEIKHKPVQERKSEYERHVSDGPTSSTVLSFGEPINKRGSVPLIITEISENVSGKITFWQIQPIDYNGDNKGKTWEFPPKEYDIGWVFSDGKGNTEIWDNSKIPQDMYGIPADGHGYPMICDSKERISGFGGHPSGIPILPEINTVHAQSGNRVYLPDSDGVYTIHFATLFDTVVEFPDSADVIESKTQLCVMDGIREEATHGYYTKLVFQFDE